MSLFRVRSKSRRREDTETAPQPPSHHYKGINQQGIPEFRTPHPRSRHHSISLTPFTQDRNGIYLKAELGPPMSYTSVASSSPAVPAVAAGYYVSSNGHYYTHGPVGHPGSRKPYHDDSPLTLSSHLETQPRGRPRSNTAREKVLLSGPAVPAYHVPLDGYTSGPASHEGSKGSLFGSFISSIRSRSRSKSRDGGDSLFSARSSTSVPFVQVDSRGRPVFEKDPRKSRDPDAELARQMEKDLRLQDMDDPYRPVRRDRSRSIDSRRHRDLDPDVIDNTQYNAKSLKYSTDRPAPMSRFSSDFSSGYATDVQPGHMRRSTTGMPIHSRSSRANPTSYGSSQAPVGWYNRRGDQFINRNTIICQPKELQYSRMFERYPEVGKGFGDAIGNVIDPHGHLIKRVG